MQKLLPIVIGAVGLALMALKISEDSEPGAIPLAMVLSSAVWYFVAWRRSRRREQK